MDGQANITEFTGGTEEANEPETVRLKHLARINPTKSELSDLDPKTDVSFVPLEDFGTDGEIKDTEPRPLEEVYDGYTYFREGDIAIAKITPSFENGKGAICRGLENGIGFGTTELHIFRPRDGVSSQFLWYLLRSEPFRQSAKAAMRGVAGQQRVPSEFLEEFSLSIAPPDKRNEITSQVETYIKRIKDLESDLHELEGLLAERRNSVINRIVTGKTVSKTNLTSTEVPWLPQMPNNWFVVKLKHIVEKPITYGIVQAGPHVESGVPYIRVSDMDGDGLPEDGYLRTSEEIHEQYSRSVVHPGDLIMAIRATVGKVMEVPDHLPEANLTQGTARISPGTSINRDYLYYLLNSPLARQHFESLSKGATFSEVTLGMVQNFEIPLPPMNEQREIVRQIQKEVAPIMELDEKITECMRLADEERRALITAAVTGQIDVFET